MQQIRKILVTLSLVFVLFTSSACATATQARETTRTQPHATAGYYNQLERGNTSAGQEFGDWVVKTGHGLIQDAYVRGDDKLGVVISPQVQPDEVRPLAKSLVQGFHRNAPNRDLTVLMYAPDKKLILTAQYDNQTKQIEYR
jgi:hypothetical protein